MHNNYKMTETIDVQIKNKYKAKHLGIRFGAWSQPMSFETLAQRTFLAED